MNKQFKRRLAAAQRGLNPRVPEIEVIVIQGGLPEPIRFAASGGRKWDRAPDEPFQAFRDRAVAAAQAEGATVIIFGGLPDSDRAPPPGPSWAA